MNAPNAHLSPPHADPLATAEAAWQAEYAATIGSARAVKNRSGIPIQPLYAPLGGDAAGDSESHSETHSETHSESHSESHAESYAESYAKSLGYPGQPPYTRGIYATMHRGRTWTQRQLIGLGTPADYNARLLHVMAGGATAVSLLPCNSVFRGDDMDETHFELLGTCGTVINTVDHMDRALQGVDLATTSCAMNDPSPFTLLAFLLVTAKRRGVDWRRLTGTSNQSDYLSHCVANHMFYRLAMPGARRVLADHIDFCTRHLPRWNPMSVVGQHMQQAGATPAEAAAFTLCTAIQNAEDCLARGMNPDDFLPRFTFFFDVSISFFEEIAKFRAARRLWARIARERLGAKDPRSWRLKFHAQTSGVDLTRQQPLNNIARVAVQAMAGIFGGLQSLHTDAYDEALSCPTEHGARIAVATQNILREEAHLTDVIDPLGGSYYVEQLTDQMEAEILRVMARVDQAGGMVAAVESGLVQTMIGESARRFQDRVERGEETVVGVNAYRAEDLPGERKVQEKPDPARMRAHLDDFARFKAGRSASVVAQALDDLTRAAEDRRINLFGQVVGAAEAGCTHGEICGRLRRDLGFGHPLTMV